MVDAVLDAADNQLVRLSHAHPADGETVETQPHQRRRATFPQICVNASLYDAKDQLPVSPRLPRT